MGFPDYFAQYSRTNVAAHSPTLSRFSAARKNQRRFPLSNRRGSHFRMLWASHKTGRRTKTCSSTLVFWAARSMFPPAATISRPIPEQYFTALFLPRNIIAHSQWFGEGTRAANPWRSYRYCELARCTFHECVPRARHRNFPGRDCGSPASRLPRRMENSAPDRPCRNQCSVMPDVHVHILDRNVLCRR